MQSIFQSTRSSQTSTARQNFFQPVMGISIHEVFADLDHNRLRSSVAALSFQSTRSSQTSTNILAEQPGTRRISIHEVFADLDALLFGDGRLFRSISIHEVFADLDKISFSHRDNQFNFNPRGLRRPRLYQHYGLEKDKKISIHEVFADLDRGPVLVSQYDYDISIHEVFADLDRGSPDGPGRP